MIQSMEMYFFAAVAAAAAAVVAPVGCWAWWLGELQRQLAEVGADPLQPLLHFCYVRWSPQGSAACKALPLAREAEEHFFLASGRRVLCHDTMQRIAAQARQFKPDFALFIKARFAVALRHCQVGATSPPAYIQAFTSCEPELMCKSR